MQVIETFDFSTLVPLVLNAVAALIILVLTFVIAGWVKRGVKRSLARSKVDPMLAKFFSSMARYAVLIVGGITVLDKFGISVATFAAVLAAAGFALGMALQGTLSHFSAGVMLLFFRPFRVGDRVSVAGVTGNVIEVGLFTTLFDTLDNRRIIVPNGAIFGSTIENITHHATRRVDVNVGTDYSADLNETRKVLEQVAQRVQGGLAEPAPQVFLSQLGGSSIDWQLRVWCSTGQYWDVYQQLTHDTKAGLDAAGIGIPFPQMDVHMDGVLERAANGLATA